MMKVKRRKNNAVPPPAPQRHTNKKVLTPIRMELPPHNNRPDYVDWSLTLLNMPVSTAVKLSRYSQQHAARRAADALGIKVTVRELPDGTYVWRV